MERDRERVRENGGRRLGGMKIEREIEDMGKEGERRGRMREREGEEGYSHIILHTYRRTMHKAYA